MMKARKILLVLVSVSVLFLTSCWDNYDVTQLAIVTAIGIDRADNGQLVMTLQILKPGAVQPGMESSKGGKAFTNITASGLTLNEAHKELIQTMGRRPFYGHIQTIILGEKLAKQGIVEALDLFERQYEFNQTVRFLLAKGMESKEILDAESELENMPAIHLMDLVAVDKLVGKMIDLPFYRLMMILESKGTSATISAIAKKDSPKKPKLNDMEIGPAGVFKKGKLVGYLNDMQVRSLLFVTNKMQETLITINDPFSPDKLISIEIIRSKTKQGVKILDGNINGTVHIGAIARIGEAHQTQYPFDPEIIEKIGIAVAKQIKKDVSNTIETVQNDFVTDIFGFGDLVYQNEYNYWKQVEKDWDKVFAEMHFDVKVDVKIKRAGLVNQPSKAR